MNNAIEVSHLNKKFKDLSAVRDLSLSIAQGNICGFLGPNGSGKTTTLRMLCGLLMPDAGTGRCLGYDIFTQSEAIKRQTGYMSQHFSLWINLTVRENLILMARLQGLSSPHKQADMMMKRMGLDERKNQLAGKLSGGWKQRLALAASLLHHPQLLLLDEPTAGVDPHARREFWHILHQLAQEGVTILVCTHYMDEAERCHQLAYLAWGELLIAGGIQTILAQQRLYSWQIPGDNLSALEARLRGAPGVSYTSLLGKALRVAGTDNLILAKTLHALSADYKPSPVETSLEDIFTHLLQQMKAGGAK